MNLRLNVRSRVKKKFFATCIVMVEPPLCIWPVVASWNAARARPLISMP